MGVNEFLDITVGPDNLFERTPTDGIIGFQQGDVVGYFAALNSDEDVERGGLLLDPSFGQEVVWYGPAAEQEEVSRRRRRQSNDCDYSVDQGGDLTESIMAGPVMSVVICK